MATLGGLAIFLTVCVNYCGGFNIDVEKPTVLPGNPGSFFGYAVTMLVDNNDKWVLVGSPRDNDTALSSIDRPGAVYKCPFPISSSPACMPLHIDNTTAADNQQKTEFNGGNKYYTPGRDGNWLGGAFDFPQNDPSKGIVTCAHRWYNILKGDYYMNGFCYVIPSNLNLKDVLKIPAMIGGSKQTIKLPWNKTVDYYSYAAVGMAVHWSKKDSKLLLGTPGLFHWTGGFVEIDGDVAKYITSESSLINDTKSDLYGSAITSGEYFGDNIVYYVFGAPRANLKGKVVLLNSNNAQFRLSQTDLELSHETLTVNAYFGSVLCTADVNNDGLDDLLVGAPLYSPLVKNEAVDTAEQGRVFLYLGMRTPGGQSPAFYPSVQTFSGREAARARFGSAITSLGDISRDTFEDIAIGAPYEDEDRGAVYIYNGYKGGLYHMFSQRIVAEEIDTGLRGFGISFSRTADINSDDTPDVAVGSYLSAHAVVLYGQRVVNLKKQLRVLNADNEDTILIARQSSGDKVKVCFKYTYPDCALIGLDVDVHLDKEKKFPRLIADVSKDPVLHFTHIRLFSDDEICSEGRLIVRSTTDLVSPIVVEAEYSVRNMACGSGVSPTINAFNGSDPGDPLLLMTTTLYFKKDCPDNKCLTDLHLDATAMYPFQKTYFTSGMPFLVLNISITKDGHPSYGSRFIIAFPRYLTFRKMEQVNGDTLVSCSPVLTEADSAQVDTEKSKQLQQEEDLVVAIGKDESGQICSIGNPVYNDSGVTFLLTLGVPREVTVQKMTLHLATVTQSTETSPADNNKTMVIELKHEIAAALYGRAKPESIFVGKTRYSDNLVKHTYELDNNGPSVLTSAEMEIHYPQYQTGGHAQLYLKKVEVNCDPPCELNCSAMNAGLSPPINVIQNGHHVNSSIEDAENMRYDSIKHLDCAEDDCARYVCHIETLVAGKGVVMSLQFGLTNELERLTKDGKKVSFQSTAQVQLDSRVVMTTDNELTEKLKTSLIPPKKEETVDWWIIVASVIGAIALLALIIFILFKCGFFKRKKWDEMKKEEAKEKEKVEFEDDKVSFTDSEDGILDKEQKPGEEVTI